MFIVGYIFTLFPFVLILTYILLNYYVSGNKSVCIVVLGDIGRSPRMQYHAVSFTKEGFLVDLIGYDGSVPHDDIVNNKRITIYNLLEPPVFVRFMPRLLAYVCKVLWQSITLALKLLLLPKSSHILLQNPPTIPTLAVVWMVCLLRGCQMVIDWHNYGYTILGLTLGQHHPLVKFSKWFERFFGKFATTNISVTKAMREDLKNNWNISAETLYDRPAEMFQETTLEERHLLYSKLSKDYSVFQNRNETLEDATAFTQKFDNEKLTYTPDRPALIVSSTSWTEDEDFGILLSALSEYELKASSKTENLPDLVCVITGKGPQKEFYKKKIESQEWTRVKFCLPWLEAEDYPKLLGSADLGVCLHKSSSGLDLPMKVVDMFGCCLPVCAVNYQCISELVQQDKNGLVFENEKELCEQMIMLLKDFPLNQSKLLAMRKELKSFQSVRWHSTWERTVLPIFYKRLKTD